MKLWQANVKMRRWLDEIRWPFVTRKRFELNSANYEAELTLYERQLNELRVLYLALKKEKASV